MNQFEVRLTKFEVLDVEALLADTGLPSRLGVETDLPCRLKAQLVAVKSQGCVQITHNQADVQNRPLKVYHFESPQE